MLFCYGSKYVLQMTLATQSFMCTDIYNSKKKRALHEYWTVIEQLNKSLCIYFIALLVDDLKMMPSKNV